MRWSGALSRLARGNRRRGPRRSVPLLAVIGVLMLQMLLGAPQAAAQFGGCDEPPPVESLGSGAVGLIDPPIQRGDGQTTYSDYSYAGHVWHTYDIGDNVTCIDGAAELSTWTGNLLFDGAKVLVAIANSIHYLVYEGGIADKMDSIVELGAKSTYAGFAVPLLGLVLIVMAIMVFRHVFSGDSAGAAKHLGRVIIGLALIAATGLSPLIYSRLFDQVLLDSFRDIDAQMASSLYGEDRVARHVLPTQFHTTIVYENWLRGEFGDHEAPLAKELGVPLVDAQACSWTQTAPEDIDNDVCDVKAKQEAFKGIADRVKNEGDYGTFTGENGSRLGTGALAFGEAVLFTPLQIACKAAILLGQIVLRMVVLFGGIIGLFCMLPGVGRNVARGTLGTSLLALVFNAVEIVHTYLLVKIFEEENYTLIEQLVAGFLITALIWSVMRPVKRLKGMVATAMHTMPGQGAHRMASWLQHASLVHMLRKNTKHRRQKTDWDWWLKGDGRPGGGGHVGGSEEPDSVYATASRPEHAQNLGAVAVGAAAAGALGAASAAGSRRGGAGDRPGAAPMAPGSGPRSPSDAGDHGGGAQAVPPIVRAEAERMDDPPHASSGYRSSGGYPGAGGGEPATSPREIPGGSLPELPAGTGTPDAARPESPSETAHPQRNPEDDIVLPSEVYRQRQDAPDIPEAPRTTAEDGSPQFVVYRPSADRPEVQAGDRPDPAPETTPGGEEEGRSDADSH